MPRPRLSRYSPRHSLSSTCWMPTRSMPSCGASSSSANRSHPSTQHSNLGGWQSSWDMDRWGGAPADQAVGHRPQRRQPRDDGSQGQRRQRPTSRLFRRNLARQHVGERQPQRPRPTSSTRHPGAFWSGVYYVDDGGIDADRVAGRRAGIYGPARCRLPASERLRISAVAMPGGLIGWRHRAHPCRKAGRLVMFPGLDDPPGAASTAAQPSASPLRSTLLFERGSLTRHERPLAKLSPRLLCVELEHHG